jgi:crotonobetainyl-CoA:carnitine CoA-transferase CaiB-like acyl-CoA transferase
MSSTDLSAPLSDVRVLDLTTFLSGPYACLVLAQLGAQIVKVEPPTGDPTRSGQPVPTTDFWFGLHRGRRSVVLDLKEHQSRDIFLDLARHADVVIENYRPGVTTRLGITPAALRAINERLIVCSISGFGAHSSMANAVAIDGVVQAFSGSFQIPPVYRLPEGPITFQIADLAGGTAAAHAVLAALYARERSGVGCAIELTLVECLLSWLMGVDRTGTLASPNTVLATGNDGGRFVVQTTLHFRTRLASLLGLEFEPTDAYADRVRDALAMRSSAEWLSILEREGIPAAPIQTLAEALAHPDVTSEMVGERAVPASPFVIDGERRRTDQEPPVLGADTDTVLREWLGSNHESR